jgi:hypothetical protein
MLFFGKLSVLFFALPPVGSVFSDVVSADSEAAKEQIFCDEAVNIKPSITVRKICPLYLFFGIC